MFRPEQREVLSEAVFIRLITYYTLFSYDDLKKKVVRVYGRRNVKNKNSDGRIKSLVGFDKIVFDKTGTSLRSTA